MEKEQLAEWLLKYDEQTLRLALMYATNYLKYGADVTEKWCTAVQQNESLARAVKDGYQIGQDSIMKSIIHCKDCSKLETNKCPMRERLFPNGEFYCSDGERN